MGRIELIIGPMYSGKSSELLKIARRYKTLNKNILLINHVSDIRYGNNVICTHDNEKTDCLSLSDLNTVLTRPEYLDAHVVIIEEGQFFNDLYSFSLYTANDMDKILIIAGLDGDYKQQLFGDILRLIPHAEKVLKLSALCKECGDGTLAAFTRRITSESDQTLVGGDNIYKAVCRYHLTH